MSQSIRKTARGVILRDDKFLLIRRTRQSSEGRIDSWLSIPGGGVEADETPQQAVIRELREELGLTVKITHFLAIQDVPSDDSRHYYFRCTILTGEPRILEQSEEYERMQGKSPNTYAIEWTHCNSPKLPNGLFWAYAEAYNEFEPFIRSELSEPLALRTEGDASTPKTVVTA